MTTYGILFSMAESTIINSNILLLKEIERNTSSDLTNMVKTVFKLTKSVKSNGKAHNKNEVLFWLFRAYTIGRSAVEFSSEHITDVITVLLITRDPNFPQYTYLVVAFLCRPGQGGGNVVHEHKQRK